MSSATQAQADLYLHLASESAVRVLRPMELVKTEGANKIVTPLDPIRDLEVDDTALAYFMQGREFVKQSVRVVAVEDSCFELEFMGKAVSAEQRSAYRVSCTGAGVTATVDGKAGCEVVDVSATGFGVVANPGLRVGDVAEVTVYHSSQSISGTVAIQSVRPLRGETRYGMQAISGELAKELPSLNTTLQRLQLRRLR